MRRFVLGLDLGIASIGWCLIEIDENGEIVRIIDLGSYCFDKLEDKDGKLENQTRREKRSIRRMRRRKQRRLEDLRNLFLKEFGVNFFTIDFSKFANPFELKVEGLNRQLSIEEIMIILYHYMKYRGFKSSRKVIDEKDNDSGKLLKEIKKVKDSLGGKNISEYLLDVYNNRDKIEDKRMHNTNGQFFMTVSRKMYLDEIEEIFGKQKLLTDDFKEKFLKIYNRQRDFSEGPGPVGPGKDSIYGAKNGKSMIQQMIGVCKFDGKECAPKESYSAQAFTLLSFLNNFKYRDNSGQNGYIGLTAEEINLVFKKAKEKERLSFNDILKAINKPDSKVKGLDLTKKKYVTLIKKFKETKCIDQKENLNAEQLIEFKQYANKELLSGKISVGLSSYYKIKKAFNTAIKGSSKKAGKELNDFISNEDSFCKCIDEISYILLSYKNDERIRQELINKGYSESVIDVIVTLDPMKETINLSIDMCRELIVELEKGMTYDKAMSEINMNHTYEANINNKSELLPEINIAMEKPGEKLTNPNVRHTLVNMRKIINALILKYKGEGNIVGYKIEMARELKESFKKRRETNNYILDARDNNEFIKEEILKKYPNIFPSIYTISKDDVIKYKLFIEQRGRSAYTNELIKEKDMFNDNLYQIDHIIPYSRSYDDSFANKVLVEAKQNQDKGNRTPREFYGNMDKIMEFIERTNLSNKKIDNILAEKIDDDFISRNINDTGYMSKLAKRYIEEFLQPESCDSCSGAITDKLKKMWKLNGYTHSYISEDLKNKVDYIIKDLTFNKDSISFKFEVVNTKEVKVFELKRIESKGNRELKDIDQNTNEAVDFFLKNKGLLENAYLPFKGKSFSAFCNSICLNADNINKKIEVDNLFVISSVVNSFIQDDRQKKNRDNDLHHALDAAVIACVTPKLINRITKYYQDEENSKVIDEATGELIENYKLFPLPYAQFVDDLVYRVYERDENRLLKKLNNLYDGKIHFNKNDVHVLLPTRKPNHNIEGAFSKETIFGVGYIGDKKVVTSRVSIEKINDKNLENLYHKNAGNKIVYDSVLDWLNQDIKTRAKYPIHKTKGNPIKSVKLIESEKPNAMVELKKNQFAANDNCIRVDVYKKKGDDRLFFVPVYYYQIIKEKNHQKVNYQIMWAQGDNGCDYVDSEKIKEFEDVAKLPRYSLIEMELKNGRRGLCYSGGLTTGMFEVYSVLGDGMDLANTLFNSIFDRYRITVSTIKSIKVRSISTLGRLN